MKKIQKYQPGCVYLFKSLSSGNSCYFETEKEIIIFKTLFYRHLKKYISIHSFQLGIEGYQIVLRVKDKRTIIKNYIIERQKVGKPLNNNFVSEVWRIISEKVRIIHSLFVRKVNRMRERSGVLVRKAFERYYFETVEEAKNFLKKKSRNFGIDDAKKYLPLKKHCSVVFWSIYETKKALKNIGYQLVSDLILLKFIKLTLTKHSSP